MVKTVVFGERWTVIWTEDIHTPLPSFWGDQNKPGGTVDQGNMVTLGKSNGVCHPADLGTDQDETVALLLASEP